MPLSWETGLALWTLGLLESDQIPELAGIAMEDGISNPQLTLLAGTVPGDATNSPEVFSEVLRELGTPLPSRPAAARVLARVIASQIAVEQWDPFEAARRLGEIPRLVGDDFHEFDRFIYAESEAESRPGGRAFFAAEIVKEAAKWNSGTVDRYPNR